ncbi:unnamed protein product, partial [Discosporangium mesarthrocarpum]
VKSSALSGVRGRGSSSRKKRPRRRSPGASKSPPSDPLVSSGSSVSSVTSVTSVTPESSPGAGVGAAAALPAAGSPYSSPTCNQQRGGPPFVVSCAGAGAGAYASSSPLPPPSTASSYTPSRRNGGEPGAGAGTGAGGGGDSGKGCSSPPPPSLDLETPRRSVMFGSPSAAEFNRQSPSNRLTPMPSRDAKALFPLEQVQEDETDEDEDTAANSAILADWEIKTAALEGEEKGWEGAGSGEEPGGEQSRRGGTGSMASPRQGFF